MSSSMSEAKKQAAGSRSWAEDRPEGGHANRFCPHPGTRTRKVYVQPSQPSPPSPQAANSGVNSGRSRNGCAAHEGQPSRDHPGETPGYSSDRDDRDRRDGCAGSFECPGCEPGDDDDNPTPTWTGSPVDGAEERVAEKDQVPIFSSSSDPSTVIVKDLPSAATAAPTPDPYGPTPQSAPCWTCGGSRWHRAGDGWACATCHPAPTARRSREESKPGEAEGAATLLALAARQSWREIEFEVGHSIGGSEARWRMFAAYGLPDAQRAALAVLNAADDPGRSR